uniref:CSON001610 protein n=2 Tax=Culicoides sonorensis TaxID=179676 RepID=A0A336MHI2_CULSO
MDKLETIPSEKWPLLRELYERDWPQNVLPYYLLDNIIRWNGIDSKFVSENIEVKCLNGDFTDGTFYFLQDNDLFFYSLENGDKKKLARLLELVIGTRDFFWTNYTYKRDLQTLDKVVELKSWTKTFVESTKFYFMPREKALSLDTSLSIPENFSVKPLSNKDLEFAHSLYPYRDEVTLQFFQMLHKFNKNLGLYKSDNLLSWCLLHQPNSFTALQTHDTFQRKGFGTIVLRNLAKSLATEGKDSFAIIVDGNEKSSQLFTKEGFDCIDEVYNIKIEPKIDKIKKK